MKIFWASGLIVLLATPAQSYDVFNVEQLLSQARSIQEVFQPNAEQETDISRTVKIDEASDRSTHIIDGLPYSWYPAVPDESTRIIHPGVLGRRLFNLASQPDAALEFAAAIESIAVTLPNGGLAWYYPRHIKVARMLGPDLVYSGMTAGDILAGYSALGTKLGFERVPSAKRVFHSLTFPWSEGGVSLYGKSLLEVPLFRAPPEIVLNGWLHALANVNDYAVVSGDEEARSLLAANIDFLGQTLADYDVPELGLSRYSDASPYRALVRYEDDAEPEFKVLYRARPAGFDDLAVPLDEIDQSGRPSLYDNQVLRRRPKEKDLYISISCSQKYDAVLLAKSQGFEVSLVRGEYDWKSTVPGMTGEKLKLTSEPVDEEWRAVFLNRESLGLICGYPTNFSKSGAKNYYHVQHFVALLYLAEVLEMEKETRCDLTYWALKWHGYTKITRPPEGLAFEDPQVVLDGLNAGKLLKQVKDAHELIVNGQSWFDLNCGLE